MSGNSSHTVSAVFTFKDSGCKNRFVDFCNGEKGLSVTRNFDGCQSIECYEKQDNANSIIIWQKWDSKEAHEAYVKFRHDDGSLTFWVNLFISARDFCP